VEKVISSRIFKYGIDKGFIRLEQFGFRNREECIKLYTSLKIIRQRRKYKNKNSYLVFFFGP